MKACRLLSLVAIGLFTLILSQSVWGEDPPHAPWVVGDSWTVESQALMSPSPNKNKKNNPVQWNFTIEGTDKIAERDCFRVKITCTAAAEHSPNLLIWLDCQNGMLARVTSNVWGGEKYISYTETYISSNGQATPVLGIIPALPLDMPVFDNLAGSTKSLEPQVYETMIGDGTTKDLGDLGFACEVSQSVQPAQNVASLTKSLEIPEEAGNVEVELDMGKRTIRQVWNPSKPWPVYSNNGVAESRLLNYTPAKAPTEEQPHE